MRFTTTSLIIAALPFLVGAAPHATNNAIKIPLTKRTNFKLVDDDGVVDIAALNAHVAKTVAKIDHGYANYEANTGVPHPVVQKRSGHGSGAVPLIDEGSGQLWQGTIAVGTPPVKYTVDFDTGSSDLFLSGPTCGSICSNNTIYKPSTSSTSKKLGKTFLISFGDGSSVSGEQYTDNVMIAGLTATKQTLGAANYYSPQFFGSGPRPDGLMGMGFKSISRYNASPVVQTLAAKGLLKKPIFSIKLATIGSELYIGDTNPDLYDGNITYTPVTTQRHWEVKLDNVIGNGQKRKGLSNLDAIIDTGTTLIIGDTLTVAEFYETINGTEASSTVGPGYYTFPCDKAPSVSFTFGGRSFPLSPSTFIIGKSYKGSTRCIGGIVASKGVPGWILGDVFFNNVYAVFDMGKGRVGFATLK